MRKFAVLGIFLSVCFFWFLSTPPRMDEVLHERQVRMFIAGDARMLHRLEMLPTFHLLLAGTASILRNGSFELMRIVSFLLGLWALAGFYFAARRVNARTAYAKLLHAATLFTVFPFLFLVYTDIFALGAILWGVCAALRSRTLLALGYACLSVVIRQNHIFWVAFTGVFARSPIFVVPIATFAAAVAVFGGISLNVPQQVEVMRVSLGNIFFLLFLLPILFLPRVVAARRDIHTVLSRPRVALAAGATAILSFALFETTHPYNMFHGHLRTYLFIAVNGDLPIRIGFSIVCAIGVLTLLTFRLRTCAVRMLPLCTVGSLLPLQLIEQRYLFPTLWLMLVFDEKEECYETTPAAAQAIYGMVISVVMLAGIGKGWWFP